MSTPNLLNTERDYIPLHDENEPRGKLTKSKSFGSILSINEKLKGSKRMPANPIISDLMRRDRMSILEHGNSAITRVPELARPKDPEYLSSVSLNREKSIKKKRAEQGYVELVSRVKDTFVNEEQKKFEIVEPPESMLAAINRKLSKKMSMKPKVHPEPELVPEPIPEPPKRSIEFVDTKPLPRASEFLFESESEFHMALKKFDYNMELEHMIFEEQENEDFEKDIDALSDASQEEEPMSDISLPPELHASLSIPILDKPESKSQKSLEFFVRMRSHKEARRTTFIKDPSDPEILKSTNVPEQLPTKEKSSFAWAFASKINASNWTEYTSQWKKSSAVSKSHKSSFTNNVLVPDGPKEFIDPAILFAEKQMEAWERLKQEMLHRIGQTKQKRFHSFSDVIHVIRGLKQLGMHPNLLNRVDKATLSIIIRIKLWKKRALENRYSRNEPIRKLIVSVDRSIALDIPPSIHQYMIHDCIQIAKLFQKKYTGILGSQHIKSIKTKEHVKILENMLLPDQNESQPIEKDEIVFSDEDPFASPISIQADDIESPGSSVDSVKEESRSNKLLPPLRARPNQLMNSIMIEEDEESS